MDGRMNGLTRRRSRASGQPLKSSPIRREGVEIRAVVRRMGEGEWGGCLEDNSWS